jgi:hypothetical protein
MVPGTAAPRPARTIDDEGAHRVHHVEEGKEADSFWVPQLQTWLGTVAHQGALPAMKEARGSSVGDELGVRWF